MTDFSRIQTVIQANLGEAEEMAHVMNWRCFDVAGGLPYYPSQVGLDAFADLIEETWSADYLNSAQRSFLSTEVAYTGVRAYSYDPDAELRFVAESPFPAPIAGSANNPLPYEVAMCVTWRTAIPGRSTRGRTYLGGWVAAAIAGQPEGRFTSTCVLSTRNNLEAFCDDVITTAVLDPETEVNFRVQPVVYSRKNDTGQLITQLSIGNVPDVQRRRRSSLIEVFSSTSIP